MKKFEKISEQFLTECKQYLNDVTSAWEGRPFPLGLIYRKFDINEAVNSRKGQIEGVCKGKDGVTILLADDVCDISRVDADDIVRIAFAVDAAIDSVMEQLLPLIGCESMKENGNCTISRENWDRLVDLASGRDDIYNYLDEELDREEREDYAECYCPKGFVTLVMKSNVVIGEEFVSWEWA